MTQNEQRVRTLAYCHIAAGIIAFVIGAASSGPLSKFMVCVPLISYGAWVLFSQQKLGAGATRLLVVSAFSGWLFSLLPLLRGHVPVFTFILLLALSAVTYATTRHTNAHTASGNLG